MHKKLVILGIDHAHHKAMIKAVEGRPDVKVVAIAQETPPYADETAAKLGVKAYRSYRECLDAEAPDIVGIAMFNGARGPWVRAALERGLPVIADKPVCTTLADLEAIRQARAKSNAPLCMMLTCRNNAVYAGAREAVRSGKIGEVLAIEGCRYYALDRPSRPAWMFRSATYGGPGLDILIHDYDLARWISGIAWDNPLLTETMTGEAALKDKQGEIHKLPTPAVRGFAEQFFEALLDKNVSFPISTEESLTSTENILKARDKSCVRAQDFQHVHKP